MNRCANLAAFFFSVVVSVSAAPYVPGYERFHSGEPAAEGGALLYSELGCANCHGGGGPIRRQGPVLPGIASRVNAEWIRSFLADPQGTKPGTNMPAMFSGPDDPRIEPVLHYLLSVPVPGKPTKKADLGKHANAERGSDLYHTIGCVACHAPSPDFQPSGGSPKAEDYSYASVAFSNLPAKYSLEALARFLEDPSKIRPDARMPNFALVPQDALDLAAHLLDFQDSDPRNAAKLEKFPVDPAKAKAGAEIYASMNCAACHEKPSKAPPRPIQNTGGGCLSADSAGKFPVYALSEPQRRAIQLSLESQTPTAAKPIEALNCLACHDHNGIGGPDPARNRYFTGDEALGDSGRLPPPLTGIGRKLQPDWLLGVLEGKNRVRPYVQTRMPVYASHSKELLALLAEPPKPVVGPLHLTGTVEAGRKLLGVQGGLNCITCHTWDDRPSLGIQALNLSDLNKRLQPDWFREYLLNPAGYRPGTLMPPLWPGGQSMLPDVLGGQTELQIGSIWGFIAEGTGLPEGFPDVTSGAFELVPKDRPIIQRAFMNGVGPFAILVGFPTGVNLAYNGETGEPAKMWKGRFFDAYSTWFMRAAPFEDPLGTQILDWPKPAGSADRFRGYRLEADGAPTFLLNVGGIQVAEHFDASEYWLRRTLTWEVAAGPEPTWTHPVGAIVSEGKGSGPGKRIFVYTWLP